MSPSSYDKLGDRPAGDPNIMRVKEVNKVRPLDNIVAGWRQHGVNHPSDPEQFQSVVCPGARSCPLCRKPVDAKGDPRFQISRRFAANVWDYDTSSVKVLVAGPTVFDEFKAAATVGIAPSSCDWTITKSGQGKQTDYKVIRHDGSPFSAAVITPEMLHSVDKYEQPTSTEAIFGILERYGIDYDALEVPSYTVEQALKFVMPYGKHKGLTIEQLVQQEQSYAEFIHSSKLEQGSLGDPVFLALQTVLEDREIVPPLEDALAMMPEPEHSESVAPQPTITAPTPTPPSEAPASTISPSSSNMVKLIGLSGGEVMVPSSAVDSMLATGQFKRPEPPSPLPSDANAPMNLIIAGQPVTLPREQALILIDDGTAVEAGKEKPEPEPEPPRLPLPDEEVKVSVGGTVVPMKYVQAAMIVDNPASNASFTDPDVASAHERVNAEATNPTETGQTSATTSSQPSAPTQEAQPNGSTQGDPERPFVCDECGASYKVQGALTQHINREHKAAVPQPTAVPSQSNGSGSIEDVVKDKLIHAPFAKDYSKIMTIMKDATGKSNFADMDQNDMELLNAALDVEIATAAG